MLAGQAAERRSMGEEEIDQELGVLQGKNPALIWISNVWEKEGSILCFDYDFGQQPLRALNFMYFCIYLCNLLD